MDSAFPIDGQGADGEVPIVAIREEEVEVNALRGALLVLDA